MDHGAKLENLQEQTSELTLKLEDLTSLLKKFEQSSKKQNHEFNSDRKKVMSKIQTDMDEVHEKIIVLFEELKKLSPSRELNDISGKMSFLDEKINLLRKNFSNDVSELVESNITAVVSELNLLGLKLVEIINSIKILPSEESLGEVKNSISDLKGNIKAVSKQLDSFSISDNMGKINEELLYFNKNIHSIEKRISESDIQKNKLLDQINKNINIINSELKQVPLAAGMEDVNSSLSTLNNAVSEIKTQLNQTFSFEKDLISKIEDKLGLITPGNSSNKISPEIQKIAFDSRLDSVEKLISQIYTLQEKLNANLNKVSSNFGGSTPNYNVDDLEENFKSLNGKINEIISGCNFELINKIETNSDFLTSEIKEIKSKLNKLSNSSDLEALNVNLLDVNEYLNLFKNQLDNALSHENRLLTRIEDKIEAVYSKDYSEKAVSGIQELKTCINNKHKEINEKLATMYQLSNKITAIQEAQLVKTDFDKLKKEIDSVATKFTAIPDELAYINSRFNDFFKTYSSSNSTLLNLAADFKPSLEKITTKLDSNLLSLNEQIDNIKTYLINNDVSETIVNLDNKSENFKKKISEFSTGLKDLAKADDLEEMSANLASLNIQTAALIDNLENKVVSVNEENKNYISNEVKGIENKFNEIASSVRELPTYDLVEKMNIKLDDLTEKNYSENVNSENVNSEIQKLKVGIEDKYKVITEKIVTISDLSVQISKMQKNQPVTQDLETLKDEMNGLIESFTGLPEEIKIINSNINDFSNKYKNSSESVLMLVNDIKPIMSDMNLKLESNLLSLNEQIQKIIQDVLKFDSKKNLCNLEKKTDELTEKISSEFANLAGNIENNVSGTLEENKNSLISEIKALETKIEGIASIFGSLSNSENFDIIKESLENTNEKINAMFSMVAGSDEIQSVNKEISEVKDNLGLLQEKINNSQAKIEEHFDNSMLDSINNIKTINKQNDIKVLELLNDIADLRDLSEKGNSKLNALDSLKEINSFIQTTDEQMNNLNAPIYELVTMAEEQKSSIETEFSEIKVSLKSLSSNFDKFNSNIFDMENNQEQSTLSIKKNVETLSGSFEQLKRMVTIVQQDSNSNIDKLGSIQDLIVNTVTNKKDVATLSGSFEQLKTMVAIVQQDSSSNIDKLGSIQDLIVNTVTKDNSIQDSIHNLASFIVDSNKESKSNLLTLNKRQESCSGILNNLMNTSEIIKDSMIDLAEWIDGAGKTIENTNNSVVTINDRLNLFENKLDSLDKKIEEMEYKQTIEQIEIKELLKTVIDRISSPPSVAKSKQVDSSARRKEYLAKYSERFSDSRDTSNDS